MVHRLARNRRGGGVAGLALLGDDGHLFEAEGRFFHFKPEFIVAARDEIDFPFDGFLADILHGDDGFARVHVLEFKGTIAVGRGVELLGSQHDDGKFHGYAGTLFQHPAAYARPGAALGERSEGSEEKQAECQRCLNPLHSE